MKQAAYYIGILAIVLVSCEQKSSHNIKKKVKITDTTLKWIDYRVGTTPPVGYYTAFDSIIKKWHIRYKRIEAGCEELPEVRTKYEKDILSTLRY